MNSLAKLEERMRRQAARGDQRHATLDQEISGFAARVAQVEANTARIATLEAQMADLLAVLPQLKGLL